MMKVIAGLISGLALVIAFAVMQPVNAGGYPHPTTTTISNTTTTTVVINTVVIVPTTTTTTGVPTSTTILTTTSSSTTTVVPTSTTMIITSSSVVPTTTTSLPPPTTTLLPGTVPPTSSATSSSMPPVVSSTTSTTTTTLPETFTFGAAGTVCVREVPTIRITFQNRFLSLAGQTGTLTMRDINGNVISSQPLVYQPGTTVDILYPGTSVNPDGSIADVPGWILNSDDFWVQDPSDEFLREGIFLTYTVNPTAGPVLVTYPPESSACANPNGPFPPPRLVPGELPPTL